MNLQDIFKEYIPLIEESFGIEESFSDKNKNWRSSINSMSISISNIDIYKTNIHNIIDTSSIFTVDEALEVFTDIKEEYGNIRFSIDMYSDESYNSGVELDISAKKELTESDYKNLFRCYVFDYLNFYYSSKINNYKRLISVVKDITIEDLKTMEVI